ncbi:MAG TPA: hypothetical protein VK607_16180, partial [Kofleriaceae bacterium]|nr:hypothetical protein [Kofleriaceae bacterium]
GALPDAVPYQHYVIDGTRLFAGAALSWTWQVTGGPCDQLFASQGKPVGFTLAGADTAQLSFTPTQVGDYTVHVAIATVDGTLECTFVVHVAGKGVRFELCWDTTGLTDLDLHVHAPHTTTDWFGASDDCYYLNCSFASLTWVDWGYPQSPLATCLEDADPTEPTGCRNPRLELDNVYEEGQAEHTSVDTPEDGATYRALANYFGGVDLTHPIANVYCQGRLVASYGQAPDRVPGFHLGGGDGLGSMWRIADVTTHVDVAGNTTCDVAAVHPPGMTKGYDVRDDDTRY